MARIHGLGGFWRRKGSTGPNSTAGMPGRPEVRQTLQDARKEIRGLKYGSPERKAARQDRAMYRHSVGLRVRNRNMRRFVRGAGR